MVAYGPIVEVRQGSAKRVFGADDAIDVEVRFVAGGAWTPFTAARDDAEAHGRALYAALARGDYGALAPAPAPAATPAAPTPAPLETRLRVALEGAPTDDASALRAALLTAVAEPATPPAPQKGDKGA